MWDRIVKISIVASALGAAVMALSVAWYVFDLEWRLRSVESQLQTFRSAPQLTSSDGTIIANPMMQACADLSKRIADVIESTGAIYTAPKLQEQFQLMGCKQ